MGKTYDVLDDRLRDWIADQHLFFVASAPLDTGGHVNLSPKGLDTFRVLDEQTVAYLDLTGSGVETIAHVRENGRLTVMFCAFEGKAKILRLFGRAEVVLPDDDRFPALVDRFPPLPGIRSVIRLDLERIQSSCGFGVPLMGFEGHRDELPTWAERKGPEGIDTYHRERNTTSIDGLAGLPN